MGDSSQPMRAEIAIIGGGLNGVSLARDAVGRGLRFAWQQGILRSVLTQAWSKI